MIGGFIAGDRGAARTTAGGGGGAARLLPHAVIVGAATASFSAA